MNELALVLSTIPWSEPRRASTRAVADWIAERCEVGPHFHDTNAGLWESWKTYAAERVVLHEASTMAHLSAKLRKLGFTRYMSKHGNRARGFKGLRRK